MLILFWFRASWHGGGVIVPWKLTAHFMLYEHLYASVQFHTPCLILAGSPIVIQIRNLLFQNFVPQYGTLGASLMTCAIFFGFLDSPLGSPYTNNMLGR